MQNDRYVLISLDKFLKICNEKISQKFQSKLRSNLHSCPDSYDKIHGVLAFSDYFDHQLDQ